MQILPAGQRATDWVVIDDDPVLADRPESVRVHIEPLEKGEAPNIDVEVGAGPDQDGWEAEWLGTEQLRLRLGLTALPIDYLIQLSGHWRTSSSASSKFGIYRVLPWQYTVELVSFTTQDESNEVSVDDEIQTVTVVSHDSTPVIKPSRIYENVDAGETHHFSTVDRFVQDHLGLPVDVKRILAVEVRLFEIDDMDPKLVDGSAQADGLLKLASILAQAPQPGVQIAGLVLAGLASILDIAIAGGMDADALGVQSRAWTAAELVALTAGPEQSFTETLAFKNADSEGSHTVLLRVSRL